MATRNRTAYETALLLALLLLRSDKPRARVSELTVKKLSNRSILRDAFLGYLKSELEEFNVVMARLKRGGFALVDISSLEGAPAIVAKAVLQETLQGLKSGEVSMTDIEDELGIDPAPVDDDE